MNLKIQKVESKQVELLQMIGRETYVDHFSSIWTKTGIENYLQTQYDICKLQEDLTNKTIKYFFAYWNEVVVGFIKLNLNKKLPGTKNEMGLELEKIYLMKNFSGKGIGEKLLHFIFEQASINKETIIWLGVLKSNEKAKVFYERNGFNIIDEIEFNTDKQKIDMWVMKYDFLQTMQVAN